MTDFSQFNTNTPEHHDPRHQSINKSVTVEAMKSLMLEEQTQE